MSAMPQLLFSLLGKVLGSSKSEKFNHRKGLREHSREGLRHHERNLGAQKIACVDMFHTTQTEDMGVKSEICAVVVRVVPVEQVSTKRFATAATSARCRAQAKYNGDEDNNIPKAPKRTDIDQLVVEPGSTYVDEI